jgi:eukaryotic-like serine/threonine-protein kinase
MVRYGRRTESTSFTLRRIRESSELCGFVPTGLVNRSACSSRQEFVATHSISPDGRRVAFTQITTETRSDIWTLPLDMTDPEHPKAGKPEVFLRTPASEMYPAFSPDGHWMVYASNETGSYEIYVRPVSGGGKWQVSTAGGNNPIWSPAGRQLFYVDPQRRITVVDYTDSGNSFQRGNPRLWEEKSIVSASPSGGNLMDVMPDGKRIVVLAEPGDSEERKENLHLTFLVNFFDEVRRRMPAGGK